MDEEETVARDEEQLEELDKEIKAGRQHLDEMTHVDRPEFYEDDETPHNEDEDTPPTG